MCLPSHSTRLRPLSRRSQMIAEGPSPPSPFTSVFAPIICRANKSFVQCPQTERPTERPPSVLRSFLPKPPRGPPSPTLSISVGSRFRRGRLSEIEPISRLLVSVLAFVATDTRWSSLHRLWIDALARMEAQYLDIPIPHGKSTGGTPFLSDVGSVGCDGILLQWAAAVSKGAERKRTGWKSIDSLCDLSCRLDDDLSVFHSSSHSTPPRSLLRINLGSNPLSRSP